MFEYKKPEIEVVTFDNNDIITTSSDQTDIENEE